MDQLENAGTTNNQKNTFFGHMSKFDDDTKVEILNLTQYAGLSIIPVVLLNKLVRRVIPETDETKGSLEILLEMVSQVIVLFVGMYYIHRLVTFVPTYSEKPYEPFVLTSIILPFLVIVMRRRASFRPLYICTNSRKQNQNLEPGFHNFLISIPKYVFWGLGTFWVSKKSSNCLPCF